MTQTVMAVKAAGETKTYTFDFVSLLGIGETLSSGSPPVQAVWLGVGPVLSAGSPIINGTKYQVNLSGGTQGDMIQVTATVVTSTGQTLKMTGIVAIVNNPI